MQAVNIMKNKVQVDTFQLPQKSPRKKASPFKARKAKCEKKSISAVKGKIDLSAENAAVSSSSSSPSTSRYSSKGEIIPQREHAKREAAKRKMNAVELMKSSRSRRPANKSKKKKPLPPKVDSSYLSESSGNSD